MTEVPSSVIDYCWLKLVLLDPNFALRLHNGSIQPKDFHSLNRPTKATLWTITRNLRENILNIYCYIFSMFYKTNQKAKRAVIKVATSLEFKVKVTLGWLVNNNFSRFCAPDTRAGLSQGCMPRILKFQVLLIDSQLIVL